MIDQADALLPRRLWSELVQWRAHHHCEDCVLSRPDLIDAGFSGRLNAHHLDEDKTNNRLSNGRCVCPSCHQKRHEKGSKPCIPGCACGKHQANARIYRGSKPCRPGCTCNRHRRPSNPFKGGANFCAPGCSCGRHKDKVVA